MSNSEESGTPVSREQALAKLKENLGDELDRLFDEAIIGAPKAAKSKVPKNKPAIEIKNYGKLALIVMPAGLVEGTPQSGETDSRRCREFHPADESTVRLVFFFRGERTSPEAAERFQSILLKGTHVLSLSELKSLKEIMRDKGEAQKFKIFVGATRELNGTKVLVVEGRYLDSQSEVHAIFIDGDGTGLIVQEIYFVAPKGKYPRYFAEATATFKSIQWK